MTARTADDAAPLERWAARASVLAVAGAVLVAGIRGAIDGWQPIGDNGLLVLRSRDVLTAHHPWLGTWTSASLSVGTPINNPGPLQFDLLAPFARLDPAAGVAVGVAVLNALAVVLAAAFAHRVGGPRTVALAMVAAGGVAWSMGSELLLDPWQPHALLLPFLALLVLAVALAAGDLVALPWAVFVGSVIVQAHLSYAVLVPGVLFAGVAWAALALRRSPPLERQVRRRRWGRALAVAALVGLVCWAQPLWEQVARDGNLATVATNAGGGDEAIGPSAGLRLAGSVLGEPTGWLRPSFEERFAPDPDGVELVPAGSPLGGVRDLGPAVASLLGLALLLGASAWRARRRGDRTGVAVAVVGGVAAALAVATAASLPVSEVFGIAAHQLRWLWPIAAVTAVLPLAALLPRHRLVTGGAAAVAVALALGHARAHDDQEMKLLCTARAAFWFGHDADYPGHYEPSGEDFFSPCLTEAGLMARILPRDQFLAWFGKFLPRLADGQPASVLQPAPVSDPTDPKIAHLIGLNLNKAWVWRRLAAMFPADDPRGRLVHNAALSHYAASLPLLSEEDFHRAHWLPSFAVYSLTE